MDLSVSNFRGARTFLALLSLTMGGGLLHAANLLNPTSSVNVTCNTATGTGAAGTITIKPVTALTTGHTITVTFTAPGAGLTVTAPASNVITTTNQTAGISYSVNVVPGCVGATTGATTLHFSAQADSGSPAADAATTVNDTVTSTASALSVTPSVTVTCTYVTGNPGTYTPGPPQTISITSQATGGTPYTLDTGNTYDTPGWLVVNPTTPAGTAGTTAQTFTVAANTGCGSSGGFTVGTSHTWTFGLLNAPAPEKTFTVTMQIVPPSPLTVTPVPAAASVTLSYVKGSGVMATSNVSVTSSVANAYVSINTSSLPIWLTVDNTSGSAPWALRFSTTASADSLSPGTYQATVYFSVSQYAPLGVPITLQINNKAPKLSVNATSVPLSWTIGTTPPTATITATSTDSPIQYTITTGGTLQPYVTGQQSGLAYSFGSTIAVNFNSAVFASAQPGQTLTGTVTLTWGSPASTTVVTFLVTVVSPGATLTGLSPASVPTAAAGTKFVINLTGTGFVGGTDPTLATRIGIIVNNAVVADTNLALSVINASNATLTITVPATADTYLPFSQTGAGGTVPLGIVNGNSSSIPSGNATLTIGVGPIIQGATSSSSFTEVTPPTLPTFAPYDMISLWGANFCSSGGTGCSSTQILTNSPDALTLRFSTTLSPDPVSATQRVLTVAVYQHNTTTLIADAPLLFATNGQINLIMPGAVSAFAGSEVDIVALFGYGVSTNLLKSTAFPVNIASSDPGIFTIGADGMGNGAILDSNWNLITSSNPAGMRTTASDSDTVQIYVTGLGAPTSNGDSSTAGTWAVPTDCVGALVSSGTSYEAALQAATSVTPPLSSIDGAVIQSALLGSENYAPCFTPSSVSVYIGGVQVTPAYAGFVDDTVAGLYQINVKLPAPNQQFYPNWPTDQTDYVAAITQPRQLPVQVTINGATSQNGVMMWVAPRLNVAASGLTSGILYAQVGVNASTTITATEGTPTYQYTLTSGLLPSGMTLSNGVISGRPGPNTAGSYTVTITATDSAQYPVTGTVTFTIQVAGGLYVSVTGTVPQTVTFGTPISPLTFAASGGKYPYTYALSFGNGSGGVAAGTPTGMAITTSGGVLTTTAATLAGTYHVTVTATDSLSVTGSYSFDIIINLNASETTGTNPTLNVVSATGNAGTLTYTLDDASLAAGLLIDTSGNITAGGATSGPYSVTVTVNDTVTLAPGAAVEGIATVGPFTVTVP